jgi:putative endonuclease
MFARLIFAAVSFAARNGLSESRHESASTAKELARTIGIRGETFAYWYLRRHGYTLVARNYTVPGIKGEIDLIGYDGRALAFVEVKTRSSTHAQSTPEDAVNADKRRNLARMARHSFVRAASKSAFGMAAEHR